MLISRVVKSDVHALLVAVDSLRRGFAVIQKLGRGSPCNFVIVRGQQCWRVAVLTVYSVSPRGRIFPKWPPNPDRFDVVAYVLPEGVIQYEPPLERLGDFEGGGPRGGPAERSGDCGTPTTVPGRLSGNASDLNAKEGRDEEAGAKICP